MLNSATRTVFVFALLFSASAVTQAQAGWLRKSVEGGGVGKQDPCYQRDSREPADGANEQVLREIPESIAEGRGHGVSPSAVYREVLYREGRVAPRKEERCESRFGPRPLGSEVRTLVSQGPIENRIDLTIAGDGYTLEEKEEFFEDAARITRDLFEGDTFKSYLALFNVHAVFVPSKQSGISDVVKKDTAFGLYRTPAGSKRAIQVGNTMAVEAALRMAPAADYPILVANDDYYGGLGGRYAITTRSVRSGKIVLRHELGHNFGQVGEEYDGGQVYSGANHSASATALPWKHWLSDPAAASQLQAAEFVSGEYLWQNLGSGSARIGFDLPAMASTGRFVAVISAVGWESPTDVVALLDGHPVDLVGDFTEDRSFFELDPALTPAPGHHTIEFVEKTHDGDNVLAFAMLYSLSSGYDDSLERVAAYPTYTDPGQSSGYRPTHNTCLMREMKSERFCPVDQENMWRRFLSQVSLIDSVSAQSIGVTLTVPPLGTGLDIRWYQLEGGGILGGALIEKEIVDLAGKTAWTPSAAQRGKFRVRVRFSTPEVRQPTDRFTATKDFAIAD